MRKIEEAEELEEIERRVTIEMKEFFRESTRMAATVLSEIHKRRSDEVEAQLEQEIAGFFDDTKARALNALCGARAGDLQATSELDSILAERVGALARATIRSD